MTTFNIREDPLKRSLTPTLVFAVGARIGSGASFVTHGLSEELKAFGYTPVSIKIIKEFLKDSDCPFLKKPAADDQSDWSPAAQRIIKLQHIGNGVRKKFGNNILARMFHKPVKTTPMPLTLA